MLEGLHAGLGDEKRADAEAEADAMRWVCLACPITGGDRLNWTELVCAGLDWTGLTGLRRL